MNTGFVTFCTENYLSIINNLLESVLKFSKHEITVYTINFDHNFNTDRVDSKRINLEDLTYYNICKAKIIASVDSKYDYCLILDGDMIATPEIDNIFSENRDKISDCKFPLFAKHPHNPFENPSHKNNLINLINRYTDKSPKIKYVYASYLFTNKSKWFLEEVLSEMNLLKNNPGEDEFVINALLTKYQVEYDIGYNYLPNCTEKIVEYYLNGDIEGKAELYDTYLKYDCPLEFYIFHGHKCKDVEFSRELIKKMEKTK